MCRILPNRACSCFDALTDGEFREKGKRLGEIAKLFVDNNVVPPQNLRPHFARRVPAGLRAGAIAAGFHRA
jgi:hypothetical protein